MLETLKQLGQLMKLFKSLNFKEFAAGGFFKMLVEMILKDPQAALAFIQGIIALFTGQKADDLVPGQVVFQSISPEERANVFGAVKDEFQAVGELESVQDGLSWLFENFDQLKDQIQHLVALYQFAKMLIAQLQK